MYHLVVDTKGTKICGIVCGLKEAAGEQFDGHFVSLAMVICAVAPAATKSGSSKVVRIAVRTCMMHLLASGMHGVPLYCGSVWLATLRCDPRMGSLEHSKGWETLSCTLLCTVRWTESERE